MNTLLNTVFYLVYTEVGGHHKIIIEVEGGLVLKQEKLKVETVFCKKR